MANGIKYQAHELLNKVLNSGEDALKVDIDNVTLTTEGGDVAIDVALDKANDSVTIYANTAADGTGTNTVPLVDAAGNLQIDIVSSALPSGGATAANQSTIIGHVDGVETLLGTIDADTNDIKTAVQIIDNAVHIDDAAFTLGTHSGMMMMGFAGAQSVNSNDAAALACTTAGALHVNILAQTDDLTIADGGNSITVDGTVTANLSATDNAVLDAIDAVLDTIKTDTGTIDSDTNDTKNALEKMLYGTALAVDYSGGDHSLGATYEAFYIGVGGDVSLDLATGGANIVFKNLASGQLLPVRATVVNQTGTTATNIVALKA
jgi:hypothetical protein